MDMENKERTCIVWVELFRGDESSGLSEALSKNFDIHVVNHGFVVDECIKQRRPHLLCFEFDVPDKFSLELMQQVKERHARLPLLMLTQYHTESLAIWAFRSRVIDFIIKPILPRLLTTLVNVILLRLEGSKQTIAQPIPLPPVPHEFSTEKKTPNLNSTIIAEHFVRDHYREAITLEKTAKLCRMKTYEFSRTFSREHGITFREFLMQHRIGRALKLLKNSNTSVSQAAYTVGFNDLSNFSRTFRRYVGITPMQFRQRH